MTLSGARQAHTESNQWAPTHTLINQKAPPIVAANPTMNAHINLAHAGVRVESHNTSSALRLAW